MSCSAIVLCGGRGSRVGGRDKGLIVYRERMLVEHVLAHIEPQVDEIIISANRNRKRYEPLGFPVVGDRFGDYQGPLAGLHAALPLCKYDRVLFAACDMPALPADLAARLLPPLSEHELAFAHDGQRDQYLVGAMRRSLEASLGDFLASGHRAVRDWYSKLDCIAIDYSDCPDAFSNLNQPEDLPPE